MRQKITFFLILLACGIMAGCGSASVTGKVTFEDGSPLTAGTVNFETDTNLMVGHLKKDGTYTLVGDGRSNGIPKGSYKVYITNATEDTDVAYDSGDVMTRSADRKLQRNLIANKYMSPSTSGLTCDVKGSMVYDIKVSPP
jgi:carbon monoxide dehydrogenase subunit G